MFMDEKTTGKILQAFYLGYYGVYLVDLIRDQVKVLFIKNAESSITVKGDESYTSFLERVGDCFGLYDHQFLSVAEIKILLRDRDTHRIDVGDNHVDLRLVERRSGRPTEVLLCLSYSEQHKAENSGKSETIEEDILNSESGGGEITESSDKLLLDMQHDIRTPMSTIIGFTNMAASHLDDRERVKDSLDKIRFSSNHLMSLFNNVVNLERLTNGELSMEEESCNLFTLLMNVRDAVGQQVKSRGLRLEMNTVRLKNNWVLCDSTRLTQLILCLLQCTYEYTTRGGSVTLEVSDSTENMQLGYTKVEVVIRDNATLMTAEQRDNIIKFLQKGNANDLNKTYGNGLELKLAKGIVDRMQGEMMFTSDMTSGTEFRVSFVLCLTDQNDEEEQEMEKPARDIHLSVERSDMAIFVDNGRGTQQYNAEISGWIEGKRLLLVEDNELNREIAEDMLVEDGFKIDSVVDGKQALEKVSASDEGYYSAILMDIQMPVMDGYEATREIRKLERSDLSSIPIIAMTANVLEQDERNARECGMNAYIAKPVDILTLRYVLRRVL